MSETRSDDPTGVQVGLRSLAKAEAHALNGDAFMGRLKQTVEREGLSTMPFVDRLELCATVGRHSGMAGPGEPAFHGWVALPLGLALALTVWVALDLMGTSSGQWAAAVAYVPNPQAPEVVSVEAWTQAALTQVAALVLCAWCSWSIFQMRRWTGVA